MAPMPRLSQTIRITRSKPRLMSLHYVVSRLRFPIQGKSLMPLARQHHILTDKVSERRAHKNIRREMRLQWNSGETHQACQPVRHPRHPAMLAVAFRKNRGDGEGLDGVAGGKTGVCP